MEIQSTIPMKNVSFKAQAAKTENQVSNNNTNPVKDGGKKLKYALGALAAAGIAAIAIGAAIHHGKGTKAVQQAAETASQTVNETVQKEVTKVSTPAITASEKHIQQQKLNNLLTGEKANKSAKSSAEVFEEAFNKIEEENAQKALEAVTGKKSGKSAQAAACAFKHAPQSISEKIADVCSYKGVDFTPNIKVEQKLKKMNPEITKKISHKDIMRALETPKQPKATKIAINKLSQLERRI